MAIKEILGSRRVRTAAAIGLASFAFSGCGANQIRTEEDSFVNQQYAGKTLTPRPAPEAVRLKRQQVADAAANEKTQNRRISSYLLKGFTKDLSDSQRVELLVDRTCEARYPFGNTPKLDPELVEGKAGEAYHQIQDPNIVQNFQSLLDRQCPPGGLNKQG